MYYFLLLAQSYSPSGKDTLCDDFLDRGGVTEIFHLNLTKAWREAEGQRCSGPYRLPEHKRKIVQKELAEMLKNIVILIKLML